jgi:hypothetical protein
MNEVSERWAVQCSGHFRMSDDYSTAAAAAILVFRASTLCRRGSLS